MTTRFTYINNQNIKVNFHFDSNDLFLMNYCVLEIRISYTFTLFLCICVGIASSSCPYLNTYIRSVVHISPFYMTIHKLYPLLFFFN
jgi:hypothetical protein